MFYLDDAKPEATDHVDEVFRFLLTGESECVRVAFLGWEGLVYEWEKIAAGVCCLFGREKRKGVRWVG